MHRGGDSSPIFPKTSKRAVVLCDGPPPSFPLLEYWLRGADLFLCADGAGRPYTQLPRQPDMIIGDFDGISGQVIDGKDGPIFLKIDEQDTTDSEKALLHAEQQGCGEAVLLGATGWLLDHTLNNCALLERFSDRLKLCLSDSFANTIRLGAGESLDWPLVAGSEFSLLPLSGTARGVDVQGALWPLKGATLSFGGAGAVSNAVDEPPLRISVKSGSLLVIVRHAFRRSTDEGAEA